jgi:hypothetical protein
MEPILTMNAGDAKEYLFRHTSVLKLTEKKCRETDEEIAKWKSRAILAASRGSPDLAREAEAETLRQEKIRDGLETEIAELKTRIGEIRRQLPGLAARERSVDPDLLEQELLIALGRTPGEEAGEGPAAGAEEGFAPGAGGDLAANAALEALKAKMGIAGGTAGGESSAGPAGKTGTGGGMPA